MSVSIKNWDIWLIGGFRMTERTFTETEINEALLEVAKTYGAYEDDMNFHDKLIVENCLMKVESAIFDGARVK